MCTNNFELKPSLKAVNTDGVSKFQNFHQVVEASDILWAMFLYLQS